MLQVTVARLRSLWPGEEICVFTSDPAALLRYCPGVTPVELPDAPVWCTDRYFAGWLHEWLSGSLAEWFTGVYVAVACRSPFLREQLLTLRSTLSREERRSLRDFLRAIATSRLLVVSGGGGIGDFFSAYSNLVLLALQCAQRREIPTAMFSHGFAPLTSPHLKAKASAILPKVDLIALREARASQPLLASVGVRFDRVVTTGDDAIELAYDARQKQVGTALGINVRLSRAAGTTDTDLERVRHAIQPLIGSLNTALLPLPVARQRDLDLKAIDRVTNGFDRVQADGRDLDTPAKLIEQIGRCRIVVTGAYHAAVFAMAQGIPAVCLMRSQYSIDRFFGLADQFRSGCYMISLDDHNFPRQLANAVTQAWEEAPRVREQLQGAAVRQVESSQAAYMRLKLLLGQVGGASHVVLPPPESQVVPFRIPNR
jgi:colanic acid/amylovoran biosynthesis protein